MTDQTTPETRKPDSKRIVLQRLVRLNHFYCMTEDYMTKWERGEIAFLAGDKPVSPKVHGRSGDGFNVSFA